MKSTLRVLAATAAIVSLATSLAACAPKPVPHPGPFYLSGPPQQSPETMTKNPDDPMGGAN